MEGSAMRRRPVKNSASSHAQAATPAYIGVDPVPTSMMTLRAPRNSTTPMVTKMSAKPVTKRSASSSRGSGAAGAPATSPSSARSRAAWSGLRMPRSIARPSARSETPRLASEMSRGRARITRRRSR